jgi:hypothetical protein
MKRWDLVKQHRRCFTGGNIWNDGKKGTKRRDELERDFESFKIGLLLRKAREEKN